MAKGGGDGTGKLLLFGGIGAAIYFGYKHIVKPDVIVPLQMKKAVEQMRIGKIHSIKFKKDTVEFILPIENPNSTGMTIKAIVADVLVKTPKGVIKIGTINHYGTDIIKPVSMTPFDLAVKINLVNEYLLISSMIAGNTKGIAVQISGTVNANGRTWPIKEQVQVS